MQVRDFAVVAFKGIRLGGEEGDNTESSLNQLATPEWWDWAVCRSDEFIRKARAIAKPKSARSPANPNGWHPNETFVGSDKYPDGATRYAVVRHWACGTCPVREECLQTTREVESVLDARPMGFRGGLRGEDRLALYNGGREREYECRACGMAMWRVKLDPLRHCGCKGKKSDT